MTKIRKAIRTKTRTTKPHPSAVAKRTSRKRAIAVHKLDWQGVAISVSYEADWLGMAKDFPDMAHAHLQIEAVAPARAELPITETGYRSHFPARMEIEQAGGPGAYVRAWLDEAAEAPAWKKRQEQSRQLRLF